jgi:galactoside O-acetyltransferase
MVLGNHVHIASHASITGGGRVLIADFCGISSGARLISGSDDFIGDGLTGPTIPAEFRQVTRGTIVLEPHVIIGSNAVVLPDVTVGEGSTVGAGSVVTRNLDPWGVYAGAPARRINSRPKEALLATERRFFEKYGHPAVEYRHTSCLDEF